MRTNIRCVEVKVQDFASFQVEKKWRTVIFVLLCSKSVWGKSVIQLLDLISTVNVFNAKPLPFFISVL